MSARWYPGKCVNPKWGQVDPAIPVPPFALIVNGAIVELTYCEMVEVLYQTARSEDTDGAECLPDARAKARAAIEAHITLTDY